MSDITQWIRNELYENSEEGYKDFHSSLVPGISNILGVRVPKLREIAKKAAKEDYREFINHVDTQEWLPFLKSYLCSTQEYEIRFSVVCLLDFFINEVYIDEVLDLLLQVHHEGYYVKMAVAWAISVCYVKFPKKTERVFEENLLDDFTHNKSIQKIRESYRVPKESKERLQKMRRK